MRRTSSTDSFEIRHGNVELRHLRYFVAAAEELNLHRAAHRLEITQPALTKQIAGLEEQMGVSLFARERHRLAGLTAAGTGFLGEADAGTARLAPQPGYCCVRIRSRVG